ncbi:MAG: MOSC domain-containing protein [Methylotenera sp.]|jgi:MOSC domain-containing protein YiiM|nr:MOSC domain-containing protein [Methylotenera sp.]
MKIIGHVHAALTGCAVTYAKNPHILSAINKKPVAGTVNIGMQGLAGDEQGDHRFHGGIDKAVNFYPHEHYRFWRNHLGAMPLLDAPGAFGENLSTVGLIENNVCFGDQLRIGTVLLEISQTRQPCWKLDYRFGVREMALLVQQSLRTGFYCRVLAPGTLEPGDAITLINRPHPNWTLQRFLILLYHNTLDVDSLKDALTLPLVPSNRKLIENRLLTNRVEDWSGRIHAPEDIDD